MHVANGEVYDLKLLVFYFFQLVLVAPNVNDLFAPDNVLETFIDHNLLLVVLVFNHIAKQVDQAIGQAKWILVNVKYSLPVLGSGLEIFKEEHLVFDRVFVILVFKILIVFHVIILLGASSQCAALHCASLQ